MEKGFTFEILFFFFFFQKMYNPIVDKSGGLKLALLCICPLATLVTPFLGFPCINAMHFPSYEFSIAILACSISLPGFDVVYFVFVLRKKLCFTIFCKAS